MPEMVQGIDYIDGPSAVVYSKFLDHLNKILQVVSMCPQAGRFTGQPDQ